MAGQAKMRPIAIKLQLRESFRFGRTFNGHLHVKDVFQLLPSKQPSRMDREAVEPDEPTDGPFKKPVSKIPIGRSVWTGNQSPTGHWTGLVYQIH